MRGGDEMREKRVRDARERRARAHSFIHSLARARVSLSRPERAFPSSRLLHASSPPSPSPRTTRTATRTSSRTASFDFPISPCRLPISPTCRRFFSSPRERDDDARSRLASPSRLAFARVRRRADDRTRLDRVSVASRACASRAVADARREVTRVGGHRRRRARRDGDGRRDAKRVDEWTRGEMRVRRWMRA